MFEELGGKETEVVFAWTIVTKTLTHRVDAHFHSCIIAQNV